MMPITPSKQKSKAGQLPALPATPYVNIYPDTCSESYRCEYNSATRLASQFDSL